MFPSIFSILQFVFYSLCAAKAACDLNYNNKRNKTDQADLSHYSLQPSVTVWPVNMEPSIEALRLGVGIFLLTYFYFNALENPETFLFYRHAFTVALSLVTAK